MITSLLIAMSVQVVSFFISMTIESSTQKEKYCGQLSLELANALQKNTTSEIHFHYHKLLIACGVAENEKYAVEEKLKHKGILFFWQENNSYPLTHLKVSNSSILTFEELPLNHGYKQNYTDYTHFIKAAGINADSLINPPLFFTDCNLIQVSTNKGSFLLDSFTFKQKISFENIFTRLHYAGAGMFIANHPDHFQVIRYTDNQFETILENSGQANAIQATRHRIHIVATDYSGHKPISSLYDQNGKMLFDNLDYVVDNPLSQTIMLRKNNRYQLLDYELHSILENETYIIEVWQNDIPYYITDHPDGKRSLFDKKARKILSADVYSSIYTNHSPYAIVEKQGKYGVIDFVSGHEWVPFQTEKIQEIAPGYLTYMHNNNWIIIDDQNQKLGSIKATRISLMNDYSPTLLNGYNDKNRMGVYDLFGREILPQQYDHVSFQMDENVLLVTLGQIQFKTDLQGKVIN